ncbi:MAG TPA: Wzz/FepE/Etk N-terminal domain-containing protein [Acidobacteriaceae bacterium]
MLGHRSLNVDDYLAILKRRWWILAIPAAIVPVIAIGATYFVTPRYESQTLVLIDQQKVPTGFVQPVVTEALDSRLAYMTEQILSRSSIEPIINQYNLYGDQHLSMDARVDLTRKAISIAPVQSDIARSNGLPGFKILFTAKDPHTAQQVCAQVTGLFTKANLQQRQGSAEETTEYLQEELDGAKRNLDDLDTKISAFQQQHSGSLPEDEGSSMNIITSLTSRLEATTAQLQTLEQNKSVAQTLLSQQVDNAPAAAAVSQQPQVLQKELDDLLAQQSVLNAEYTPEHPDVKAIARKIADKRREIAKAESAPPPAPAAPVPANRPEPANVVSLRAQLRGIDQMIQSKHKEQDQLQGEIRGYQGRVQAGPEVAAQFKQLTRDYDTASAFYNQLLQKKNSSQMTTDLEHRMQGETFTVLDPASLPVDPSWPKQSVFAMGGLGGGLALGLLIAGLLEYKDTALQGERDVWEFTQLPTLAVIAWSGDAADNKKPSLMKRLFSRKSKDMLADASG